MRAGPTRILLVIASALALVSAAEARTSRGNVSYGPADSTPPHGAAHAKHGKAHVSYGPHRASRHGRHRYVDLAGDPYSGYGFYPLPVEYQIGAWHYHLRHRVPPWQNPVRSAVAADALRTYGYGWIPADRGYRYGVFDPIEGVGTPFFAGYYGPAGDDDEPPTLFGRPYPN